MRRRRPSRAQPIVELVVHPDVVIDPRALERAACRAASVSDRDVQGVRVLRRAIDARRGRVRLRLRVAILLGPGDRPRTPIPEALASVTGEPEVVIVGAGPAGLFCALGLARAGIRVRVLERGAPIQTRRRAVAALAQRGELDPDCNYCFGEGGAGTFSDGKLYTRSSKRGPVADVLQTLVAYGAPAEIEVDTRPHIGTNRLPRVVECFREHLASAGHELRFGARVTDLTVRGGRIVAVHLADGERVPARAVVLATGHSAADVYHLLARHGARLEAKPFAMGVRVEHAQAFVDQVQFGALAGHPALGAAAYRLVEQVGDNAVFSFCMCPGGFIVPAATHAGQQVVNGWSPHTRRGRFANSGLVVNVQARELAAGGFDPLDPFAGLAFQAELERRAFEAGGGGFVAPGQRLSDLVAARTSTSLPGTSYPRGARPAPLHRILGPLAGPLQAALVAIDAKLPGFAGPEALAVGVESRTSAPVRILRASDTLQAPGIDGLYPAAEGAGYAGGIMSAALDGLRLAQAIAGHPSDRGPLG